MAGGSGPPTVSVVIAAYNRAAYVAQAIESALAQTSAPFEIIVVDDGSTDETPEILARFGDRIQVIRQPNRGRSAARNRGVEAARGDIVAFLDSDDVWLPDKLAKQLTVLKAQPEVGLVHTFSDVVDADGRPLRRHSQQRRRLYARALRRGYTYEGMSQECIMFLSTVAVRRERWEQIGPMDPEIPAFEDWDWYLRAARLTAIATIPEPLVLFRLHSGNTSSADFFRGRIGVCHKHLAWLEENPQISHRDRIRRNFHLQMAAAHYVQGDTVESGLWLRRAARLDRSVLLHPRYARYALAALLPHPIVATARGLRRGLTGWIGSRAS